MLREKLGGGYITATWSAAAAVLVTTNGVRNITSIPAPFTSLIERCVLILSQKTDPYSDILFHHPIEESMKSAGRCWRVRLYLLSFSMSIRA